LTSAIKARKSKETDIKINSLNAIFKKSEIVQSSLEISEQIEKAALFSHYFTSKQVSAKLCSTLRRCLLH
jgi:hypothetical protein